MVLVTLRLALPLDLNMCLLGALALTSLWLTTSSGLSLKKSSSTGVDERSLCVGATECLPTADLFHNHDLAAKPLQAMVGMARPKLLAQKANLKEKYWGVRVCTARCVGNLRNATTS